MKVFFPSRRLLLKVKKKNLPLTEKKHFRRRLRASHRDGRLGRGEALHEGGLRSEPGHALHRRLKKGTTPFFASFLPPFPLPQSFVGFFLFSQKKREREGEREQFFFVFLTRAHANTTTKKERRDGLRRLFIRVV